MSDPLDVPPPDHGSDRYRYVELQGAPPGVAPSAALVESLLEQSCLDCNPNLFMTWRPKGDGNTGDGSAESYWWVTVAHDTGCPTYARLEREGRLGGG